MITTGSKVVPSDPSVPSEESDSIPTVRPVARTAWPVPFQAATSASDRSGGHDGRPPEREVALAGRPIEPSAQSADAIELVGRGRPSG